MYPKVPALAEQFWDPPGTWGSAQGHPGKGRLPPWWDRAPRPACVFSQMAGGKERGLAVLWDGSVQAGRRDLCPHGRAVPS